MAALDLGAPESGVTDAWDASFSNGILKLDYSVGSLALQTPGPGKRISEVLSTARRVSVSRNRRNLIGKVAMSKFTTIRFAHELDAAWIIALWKAIHGGDPPPEEVAIEAIAALSGTLTSHAGTVASESSFGELQTRLKEIGVDLQQHAETGGKAAASTESNVARTYCVVFKGQRICVTLPRPFVWPPGH